MIESTPEGVNRRDVLTVLTAILGSGAVTATINQLFTMDKTKSETEKNRAEAAKMRSDTEPTAPPPNSEPPKGWFLAGSNPEDYEVGIDQNQTVHGKRTGYIKSRPLGEYRAQKRGGRGKQVTATKEDDFIDSLDLTAFNTYFLAPAGLPGDFNNDHRVDAADYTIWRNNLGAPTEATLNGNGDGIGGVDANDYALWKSKFGTQNGAGAGGGSLGTVPEPGALLLALVAVFGLIGVAPRRSKLG